MSERDTLTGRARRFARVGLAAGGMAARAAGGHALGRDLFSPEMGRDLKAALGGLKGPLMKVAQILATIPDALPAEFAAHLAELQTNAPSMGWAFVKRRMAAELGPGWPARFADFSHTAAAAASLGQVHRATALDGRALACKLQYPDMASAVEADLQQLKLVFALWRRTGGGAIDPVHIHAELSARLREELDYAREAHHMALYRHMLAGEAGVQVPEPLAALSTGRLLTMTWLDGRPLAALADAPLAERNRVAYNMFRAWYVPFYDYGIIHGDPHLGNYTVRGDGVVNLLDFGCIRVFRAEFVGAVIDLYRALRDDDPDLEMRAYETWGFRDLSREVRDILNRWARFIYGPLMEDRVQGFGETAGVAYGARVASDVYRELKRAGGVAPPREFPLMERAAIGLGSVFLRLRAEVNWYRHFHDLIEGYDAAATARRQAEALKAFDIPTPA